MASAVVEKKAAIGDASPVAWVPRGEISVREWIAVGRRLGPISRSSQWWIGDWVRYGSAKWGERYAQAARITGYDVASLRNMVWVASKFDPSLRNDKLSWSHHVLLAPLDTEQQRYWLERAEEERLSVADLRIEIRAAVRRELGPRRAGAPPAAAATIVCPNCGHSVTGAVEASGRPTDPSA
jgi:hypothetical protein